MLKNMTLVAVLAATPALAGPCDEMHVAASALDSAIAKTEVICDTDNTLTGPCSHAIIAAHRATDMLKDANARCKAAIDAAKAAIGTTDPEVPTWSYDPPPPWRPDDQ